MTKISDYQDDTNFSDEDRLVGTDSVTGATKEYSLLGLKQYIGVSSGGGPIGPQGPQGVQGPEGPQGDLGPVGPAGLNWQGAWVSGTSYTEDDAVGYNGASWFCILATSGTTAPNLDTAHWALLASQGATGATGATGAQGPQGAQGPAGVTDPKVWKAVIDSTSVITVLKNEIGFTGVTVSNPSNGKIEIIKSGFFTSLTKVDFISRTANNFGTPFVTTFAQDDLFPNDKAVLNIFDMAGGQTSTPGCTFTVEIQVYA